MLLLIWKYWGQVESCRWSTLTLTGRYPEDGGQECHCSLLMSPIIFDYQLSNKDSCSPLAFSTWKVLNFFVLLLWNCRFTVYQIFHIASLLLIYYYCSERNRAWNFLCVGTSEYHKSFHKIRNRKKKLQCRSVCAVRWKKHGYALSGMAMRV